jgi:hypothetical protein
MFKVLKFRFKVFLTKLKKGQYSLEYVNLFKDNDLRSPFTPCINDEFIFHVLMYLKRKPDIKVFQTNENIQFGNISFNLSFNELLKSREEPSYFNASNFDKFVVKIVGYQDDIVNSKMKTIYYFVDDVFILGENSFNDTSISESINISKILIKKYISESIGKSEEFFIEDKNKNMIYYYDNGFERSIKYFNSENEKSRNIYKELSSIVLDTIDSTKEIESRLSQIL